MITDERKEHRRRSWKMDDNTAELCGRLLIASGMMAAVQSVKAGALV